MIYSPSNFKLYAIIKAAQTYDFVMNMLILFALIYLRKKVPLYHDHFYVREELGLVFWCAMMYYASVITLYIALIATEGLNEAATIFTIIHAFFALLSQTMIILVQTKWVLNKISKYLHIQSRLQKRRSKVDIAALNNAAKTIDEENYTDEKIKENQENRSNGNFLSVGTSNDEITADDYQKMEDFTVNDLLEHNVGFDAFMMHLIREFSMEC